MLNYGPEAAIHQVLSVYLKIVRPIIIVVVIVVAIIIPWKFLCDFVCDLLHQSDFLVQIALPFVQLGQFIVVFVDLFALCAGA